MTTYDFDLPDDFDMPDDMEDDPDFEVYSLEELEELAYARRRDEEADGLVDDIYGDGSTTNPQLAWEEGLVYDPPSDPPVLASDNSQGVEVAAGFASSMEEANPDVEDLPARVDNQDLDLKEDIETVLRDNSETADLDNIHVAVRNGVVRLRGTVPLEEDISIVERIVSDLDGVVSITNRLRQSESA
ncbi:MAG: BON domain-containing protein [Caldilineaceae bacterium]